MLFTISEAPKIHLDIRLEKEFIVQMAISSSQVFTCSLNEQKDEVIQWLSDYSLKKETVLKGSFFNLDLLSPIMQIFLQKLKNIPFGQSLTYGQLGKSLNLHPRAIGNLCKKNPFPLFYPCHRILAGNNLLGGFNFGLETKMSLLTFENINFSLK